MSSETRDTPHLSGTGLLAYIRENGIDINNLKFGKVPRILLKSHGEDTSVNVIVVDLLLDDRNGEIARQFAQRCPAYEDNRGSENVGELQSLFETFIHTVLLGEKRETSKKRNEEDEDDEIMDTQTEELNQLHAQIDQWLDTWSEKYDELVGKTTEYICLLDDIYLDPKPESYKPKGIDTESSDEDKEEEYIPNHHLDTLSRIMFMLESKVKVSRNSIDKLKRTQKKQQPYLKIIKDMIPVLVSFRDISWDILERYPGKKPIQRHVEEILNTINEILAENK